MKILMRMIDVLKELNQIDWNVLLIGFELDWCTREDIIKKYQYVSLSILLKSSYSSDKKVQLLQEIYADFGYPDSMRACSIYGQGGMPLLNAARKLVSQLEKEYIKK